MQLNSLVNSLFHHKTSQTTSTPVTQNVAPGTDTQHQPRPGDSADIAFSHQTIPTIETPLQGTGTVQQGMGSATPPQQQAAPVVSVVNNPTTMMMSDTQPLGTNLMGNPTTSTMTAPVMEMGGYNFGMMNPMMMGGGFPMGNEGTSPMSTGGGEVSKQLSDALLDLNSITAGSHTTSPYRDDESDAFKHAGEVAGRIAMGFNPAIANLP